jgi:hypothetical protein
MPMRWLSSASTSGSDVHQGTRLHIHHLSSTFTAMDEHQAVQIMGSVAAVHLVLVSNRSCTVLTKKCCCQLWG